MLDILNFWREDKTFPAYYTNQQLLPSISTGRIRTWAVTFSLSSPSTILIMLSVASFPMALTALCCWPMPCGFLLIPKS